MYLQLRMKTKLKAYELNLLTRTVCLAIEQMNVDVAAYRMAQCVLEGLYKRLYLKGLIVSVREVHVVIKPAEHYALLFWYTDVLKEVYSSELRLLMNKVLKLL